MDHRADDSPRLVGTVTPAIPVYAVYYNPPDDLFTEPILFFNIWEKQLCVGRDASRYADIQPVPFSSDYLDEANETSNFLGLSLSAEPDRKQWESQIGRLDKQSKVPL